jgi:hypothetical protein
MVKYTGEGDSRGSLIGIATYYGLDGLGFNLWWGGDFPRPFRPDQPPVKLVPRLFPEGRVAGVWL